MRIKKFNESSSDCSFKDFKDIMMDILDDVENEHRFEETDSYYKCIIFLDSVNSYEPIAADVEKVSPGRDPRIGVTILDKQSFIVNNL